MTDSNLLAPGQVVRLNSGSLDMIVDYFNDSTMTAHCVWFGKDLAERRDELFAAHTLRKVNSKHQGASKPFAPGDVVRLLIGGPLMTVSSMDEHSANCIWFDPKNPDKPTRFGTFDSATLLHLADLSEDELDEASAPWDVMN